MIVQRISSIENKVDNAVLGFTHVYYVNYQGDPRSHLDAVRLALEELYRDTEVSNADVYVPSSFIALVPATVYQVGAKCPINGHFFADTQRMLSDAETFMISPHGRAHWTFAIVTKESVVNSAA